MGKIGASDRIFNKIILSLKNYTSNVLEKDFIFKNSAKWWLSKILRDNDEQLIKVGNEVRINCHILYSK